MRSLAVIAAAVLGLHPLASGPENGRIVVDHDGRLATVNADGTGPWPIARGFEDATYAPDGSALAAVGDGGTWILTASGSPVRKVAVADEPSWAPSGDRLALRTFLVVGRAIETARVDGSDIRAVTTGCVGDPAWSPDGARIAFANCAPRDEGVWTVNPDGGDAARLTTGDDTQPAWSPDGAWIAFARRGKGIWLARADGSDAHALTSDLGSSPAWSPRGDLLVYSRAAELAFVTPAGAERAAAGVIGLNPSWQRLDAQPGCPLHGAATGDTIVGGPQSDIVCGGPGRDNLRGGDGADVLRGGDGADRLVGGPGSDVLQSGAGDDVIDARDGVPDVVDGGGGHDAAVVDPGDRVRSVERVSRPELRNLARGKPVEASFSLPYGPPELAVDGHGDGPPETAPNGGDSPWWASDGTPQWIEIDLGRRATVRRLELAVAQPHLLSGHTVHVVYGGAGPVARRVLHVFVGETTDGDQLRFSPRKAWRGVRYVRVETLESPFPVAWREIRVLR